MRARLVLEEGRVFEGVFFGASREARGGGVFHTGLTGYQEILTGPSYSGQLLTPTYPHIGNYGVNTDDGRAACTSKGSSSKTCLSSRAILARPRPWPITLLQRRGRGFARALSASKFAVHAPSENAGN